LKKVNKNKKLNGKAIQKMNRGNMPLEIRAVCNDCHEAKIEKQIYVLILP